MKIGVPKEIKNREARVGLTPAGARELVLEGHAVAIERGAGAGVGFGDEAYVDAGCRITRDPAELFDFAEMVVKVKEPQPEEIARLRPHHVLFGYLHLAADACLTRRLQRTGATCIAFETVTDSLGRLPLLTPMSEVAGRLAVQAGARHLESGRGGPGVLLGGVTGVRPATVVVVGGGVAGLNAAQMAVGLGADTTIFERSLDRIRELDRHFGDRARTLYSTESAIERELVDADLVVGAVLLPGARAPRIITRRGVSRMKPGAVIVDIAIDQGGCIETSEPTSHDEPTFVVDGIVHYCVTNMPALVARTSTEALSNATLPFVKRLAAGGADRACREDPHLAAGVNVRAGRIVHEAVRAAMPEAL